MANKVEVYHGNCHCGAFRFELRASEIVEATVCDCTLCVKKGYLWFKLGSGDLTVTRDEELLMNYESKVLRDRFCGTCGTGVLGEHTKGSLEGQKLVNLRTVQDLNPFKLQRQELNPGFDEMRDRFETNCPVQIRYPAIGR